MSTKWILRIATLMQLSAVGILFAFEAVRMKDMGIGEAAIGIILGISSGVFIVSSVFWGRLADSRHWHRQVAVGGSVGASALLFYFSFCESTLQFLIYGILKAIALPMVTGMMPALAIQTLGRERQGSKIGIFRSFGSLGFILGTMALPLIFNDLAVVARIGALVILTSTQFLRRLPAPEIGAIEGTPLGFRGLNPAIRLFLASYFFVALAEPSVHPFFWAYARQLGASTRLLGLLSGTMGFVALISLPMVGRWIDRANPAFILSVAFLAQPVRVFLISLIGEPEFLWIPLLLHGVCWGGIEVAAIVYLSSLAKENQRATVISFYMAMRMFGILVGASISGYIAENLGYTTMFRSASAAALVGAAIYIVGTYGFKIGRRRPDGQITGNDRT